LPSPPSECLHVKDTTSPRTTPCARIRNRSSPCFSANPSSTCLPHPLDRHARQASVRPDPAISASNPRARLCQPLKLNVVQHRTCIQRARYLILRSVTTSKHRRRLRARGSSDRAIRTQHSLPLRPACVSESKRQSGGRFLTLAPTSWGCPVKYHEELWCLAHTNRPHFWVACNRYREPWRRPRRILQVGWLPPGASRRQY
jgi:hypothetical protein